MMEFQTEHDVQILNHTDEVTFKDAFTDLLNRGYTLVSTNAYFDHLGKQYFYAVFGKKIPKEKKPIGFNFGG